MQTQPSIIQKLFRIYELYLKDHKRGHLCTIHSLMNDEDVISWIDEHNSIGRDLDEKLYLIYHNIDHIEMCPICCEPQQFSLKHGYRIDGMKHRRCKKYPYSKIFKSYYELYGISELKTVTPSLFIQKHEIPTILNEWMNDHPLFSNYSEKYALLLFSYISTDDDLDEIPMCKYCGKYKSSINHAVFTKNKTIYFNDYCMDCVNTAKGEIFSKTAKELYGVDNYSQLDSVKKKKINTCRKTYGVDNPMQSDIVKANHVATCVDRYGVENVSQLSSVKNKKKNTILKHYGSWDNYIDVALGEFYKQNDITNSSQLDSVKSKKIQTSMINYGVANFSQTDIFKKMMMDTKDERMEKSKMTCIERYGVPFYSMTSESRILHREILRKMHENQVMNNEPCYPIIGTDERRFLNSLQNCISYVILRNPYCDGYFLDGYIAEKNIVFEFDEDYHYDANNELCARDIERQCDIEKFLQCTTVRVRKSDWLDDDKCVLERCVGIVNECEYVDNDILIKFESARYCIERKYES